MKYSSAKWLSIGLAVLSRTGINPFTPNIICFRAGYVYSARHHGMLAAMLKVSWVIILGKYMAYKQEILSKEYSTECSCIEIVMLLVLLLSGCSYIEINMLLLLLLLLLLSGCSCREIVMLLLLLLVVVVVVMMIAFLVHD